MRRSSSSISVLLTVLLAGCAVGPDFVPPSAPDVTAFDFHPLAQKTSDGAQELVAGQDITAQWWGLFHSKKLDALVQQALNDNPDLASAQASLRMAEDNLAAGSSAFFPAISGAFTADRDHISKISTGSKSLTYNLYNASVGVSYDLDIWGGTRREVEQLQAQVDAARFQHEAAYLSLTSNVVTAAIQEASLRAQLAALDQIIDAQEKTLAILKTRFEVGAVAKAAVLQQQATLASAKANRPPLEHQLVVTQHALQALVGQLPSKSLGTTFELADLKLPVQVPVSLPSKLVEQRPDVRVAQEYLHAASAAIGVAQAARLPNIRLSADVGSMAKIFGDLFSPGGGFWSLGAAATQTLFDAGRLSSEEQFARDAYDKAQAQYKKTVLAAFQNVADTLHALQSDADNLIAKAEAAKAAADSLQLIKVQFETGAVSMAELLNAEQLDQQAKSAYVQAQGQRYADTAALFAALGGGWWNRDAQGVQVSKGDQ